MSYMTASRPVLALALFTAFPGTVFSQVELGDAEEQIIHYNSPDGLEDPVALLQKRLAEGKTKLRFEPSRGYLASLLKELRVPVSSQGLVFSKTSFQRDRISITPAGIAALNHAVAYVMGGNKHIQIDRLAQALPYESQSAQALKLAPARKPPEADRPAPHSERVRPFEVANLAPCSGTISGCFSPSPRPGACDGPLACSASASPR